MIGESHIHQCSSCEARLTTEEEEGDFYGHCPSCGLQDALWVPLIEDDEDHSDLFEEASAVVHDRENVHGSIQKTHRAIGEFWSAYLRAQKGIVIDISPAEAADMLDLFKDARKATGETNKDTYRDALGYNYCAWACREAEE